MTINGANFNVNNMNAVMGTGAAQTNKAAGNNTPASVFGARRSDKLDLSRFGQRYLEASDADKATVEQMIREASEMYGYSNFEKASESYWEMKKMIRDEVNRSEADIKGVERYHEERKYYQDILDRTNGDKIYIGSDKYGWIAAAGKSSDKGYISRSDLMEAMSKAESRAYDRYIGRYTEDVDYEDYLKSLEEDGQAEYAEGTEDISEALGISPDEVKNIAQNGEELGNWGNILSRKFNKYADIFSSVTHEDVPYMDSAENNPLFSREGLTLDNFIEKTNERLGKLHDTEKALQKAMEKYIRTLTPQDMEPAKNFIDVQLELFFNKQESVSELLSQFNENSEVWDADRTL